MRNAIRRIFRWLSAAFDIRLLGLGDGGRRYVPPKFSYPSTEESWNTDWKNIGNDFRRAAARFEAGLIHA